MPLVKAASHLLLYSFAFGGSAFYSYVASPIAFKVLARDQFSILQSKVFPSFFAMQGFSPMLLALTAPMPLTMAPALALSAASASGLLNLFWLLPWNRKVKEQRLELKTKYKDDPEKLEELDKALRTEFGKSHGISLLFNVSHVISLIVYGVYLSKGLLHFIPK
ncbi:similar to Saccharomyces cerevisiae YPR098C Protein of unknown function, localized to the mitochondrial outer membrane [Maudiozyma barnettii]|uniref:TMEM205-like domain-containing protein n=1 Tax=Maudiozyma barnettii TaxID=61262 RepID=A0A8H2ZF83_9SACH|nr:Tmh18p [Kazachstania barnettii]CAB4252070.1 similar to Saccharomyces cerevisiae YPR098C Protein of unknown function, localized to the mitochondrial outer membrane [Kazachstania barnettii]CAD1778557.1 similar to Saccharomyces cerevisiae YPR098C Protein of unknown function, localized to the mitochondrial outer membrane [Kazachstania barnettii]